MRKRRRSLYHICGIILGISCMLSACHEKQETFTSVAAVQEEADAGEKMQEAGSEDAAEKPDETKADPGGEEKAGAIWVYVCGEVAAPGVYELREGDRITHAIEAAGGLTEAAGQVYLNQAAHLTDGQKIYVPSKEEEQSLSKELSPSDTADGQTAKDTGKVNLNTATKAELLSLNGIGESRAEAILAYREASGGFGKIEDLKKVDGIKDGIFQKIREQITVE